MRAGRFTTAARSIAKKDSEVSAPTLVRAYTDIVHAWPQALAASAGSTSRLKIRTARLGVNPKHVGPHPAPQDRLLFKTHWVRTRKNSYEPTAIAYAGADHMRPSLLRAGTIFR